MFSRKIRHVAIPSGSIRWISIRFDALYTKHWPVPIKANYRFYAIILFKISLTLGKLCDWLNVQKPANHR